MESNEGPADQIRQLERGEAAPYIDVPAAPRWVAPLFGAWSAAYVGSFALWNVNTLVFIAAMLVLTGLVGGFFGWFTQRYGAFPMPGRGTPPPEIRREYRLYFLGTGLVAALVALVWWLAGLAAASAAAFLLVTAGLLLYDSRYSRASNMVRRRLS